MVAVVGEGMAGTPGVAKRVFGALGNSMINIIMISQGSSQYNTSFVVQGGDAFGAVKTCMTNLSYSMETESKD